MLCLSRVVLADNTSITSAGIGKVKTGAAPSSSGGSGKNVWSTILGILFILAVLAMIAHMVYVNYFTKPYPEVFDSANATPENNAYVKNALDVLYNGEFTPLCDPNEVPGPDDDLRYYLQLFKELRPQKIINYQS